MTVKTNTGVNFSAVVISDKGVEPSAKQIRYAIIERAKRLTDAGILEATDLFDPFEEETDEPNTPHDPSHGSANPIKP